MYVYECHSNTEPTVKVNFPFAHAGVILSAVLQLDESLPPFLLALDATTMSEIGRVEFPGIQWHKDVHGIFVPATTHVL